MLTNAHAVIDANLVYASTARSPTALLLSRGSSAAGTLAVASAPRTQTITDLDYQGAECKAASSLSCVLFWV